MRNSLCKTLKASLALILCLALLLSAACLDRGKGMRRYQASFLDVFDTVTIVVVFAKSESEADALINRAHELLLWYHRLFDIYNAYEGVNNACTVNENAGIAPVKVDKALIELAVFSKEMYGLTGGTVNIAMGSVLSIWHDYREAGTDEPDNAELPELDALKAAAEHTDIDKLIIDEQAQTLYLEDAEMRLDLGAIAKGYAAGLVVDVLTAEGAASVLLSVGGNVCSIGKRGDNEDWQVSVEDPFDASTLCVLPLDDSCLVTSGSYQRYYTVDGVRYHHIIDPATLYPSTYFSSVSVMCADSGLADALSTALFNLPLDKGQTLIEELSDVEVLWVDNDGKITATAGFYSGSVD